MRAARTPARSGGDGAGHGGSRARRVALVLVTVGLLSMPVAALASTAVARTGRPAKVAPVCTNGTYTVRSGDGWSRISSGLHVTMAALLAGLPLAFGSGLGSELRRPLGIAMVGGLLLSQVLTLYTTPVIYIFFDKIAMRFSKKRKTEPGATTPSPEPA